MEIWKDVKGYEGLYQVSDLGRVRSLDRVDSIGRKVKERILKPAKTKKYGGYLIVCLYKNSKSTTKQIHQLIAEAFLNHEPCGHVLVVDHIDNNKLNNKLSNLQVITNRQNISKDQNGKCKSTGVYLNKSGNVYCRIALGGKNYYLGTFKSEKEASNAYKEALQDYENGVINVNKYKRKKSSKYKNVSWYKPSNKWVVQKKINGKNRFFGYFDSEEEAYNKAKELFNI